MQEYPPSPRTAKQRAAGLLPPALVALVPLSGPPASPAGWPAGVSTQVPGFPVLRPRYDGCEWRTKQERRPAMWDQIVQQHPQLLGGYDKAADPGVRRQRKEIQLARARLASWMARVRMGR